MVLTVGSLSYWDKSSAKENRTVFSAEREVTAFINSFNNEVKIFGKHSEQLQLLSSCYQKLHLYRTVQLIHLFHFQPLFHHQYFLPPGSDIDSVERVLKAFMLAGIIFPTISNILLSQVTCALQQGNLYPPTFLKSYEERTWKV